MLLLHKHCPDDIQLNENIVHLLEKIDLFREITSGITPTLIVVVTAFGNAIPEMVEQGDLALGLFKGQSAGHNTSS